MSNASMTPGSRPRRGVIALLGVVTGGLLVTAVALAVGEAADPPDAASAVDLATFSSCEDLAAWGRAAMGEMRFETVGDAVATDDAALATGATGASGAAASTTVPAAASAGPEAAGPETAAPTDEADAAEADDGDGEDGAGGASRAAAEDGTNVAVEGVDEIDLVDRLGDDLVLVASSQTLAVVDLAAGEVRARVTVPWDAQISYDPGTGVAWVVGHLDSGGLAVERVAVGDAELTSEGRWTTDGWLVGARRVGDVLHVVASDGFRVAEPVPLPSPIDPRSAEPGTDGATEPIPSGAATDPDPEVEVPFADGPVPCDEVLHAPGTSDPTATLLVTLPATGAVEPVRATEVVGSGDQVHMTTEAAYLATPDWTTAEVTTGIHRFDLATLTATGSGVVEGSLLDDFSMSEDDGVLRVAVTRGGGAVGVVVDDAPVMTTVLPDAADDALVGPTADPEVADDIAPTTVAPETVPPETVPPVTDVPASPPPTEPVDAGLNAVVVLDTDGALEEIGRTVPFGHPGETIQGVRFSGDVGYAVTFLQTDPFYVLDLADPTAPAVVGEVELPGFSSYLHPLDEGLVVGFGPGADGRPAAKLFDVSDPTAPAVVDDLVLGDDSAVTTDHHAFVDLGDGRFAVPAATWAPTSGQATSEVVEVDTSGGALDEEARIGAATDVPASRAIPTSDGWALLADSEIVVLDASGDEQGRVVL